MDINSLFEDLEAQFAAEIDGDLNLVAAEQSRGSSATRLPPSGPILVEVQCLDGSNFRLIAVTVGLDFVAGVDAESSTVMAIANRAISSMRLHRVSAEQSFDLKITGREFTEFCSVFSEKKSPLTVHFLTESQSAKSGWITGQFLNLFEFTDRTDHGSRLIPSVAVARIEVAPVHN